MAGRYLVTGVQLGILMSPEVPEKSRQELFEEILQNQFVGSSSNEIKSDVKKVIKGELF